MILYQYSLIVQVVGTEVGFRKNALGKKCQLSRFCKKIENIAFLSKNELFQIAIIRNTIQYFNNSIYIYGIPIDSRLERKKERDFGPYRTVAGSLGPQKLGKKCTNPDFEMSQRKLQARACPNMQVIVALGPHKLNKIILSFVHEIRF